MTTFFERSLGTLPRIPPKRLNFPRTSIGQGQCFAIRGLCAIKGLQRLCSGLQTCEFEETSWATFASLKVSHQVNIDNRTLKLSEYSPDIRLVTYQT